MLNLLLTPEQQSNSKRLRVHPLVSGFLCENDIDLTYEEKGGGKIFLLGIDKHFMQIK